MTDPSGRHRSSAAALCAVALFAVLVSGCTSAATKPARQRPDPTTPNPTTATSGKLIAPNTSYAQNAAYFQDLAKTDPSLSSYVNTNEEVALQALLTDGSAFCAFLNRGGTIDNAMESVVLGARSVESQTHLPLTVATFNAIDAVALVDLCPTEQKLLPATDRAHIQSLTKSLSEPAGAPTGSG